MRRFGTLLVTAGLVLAACTSTGDGESPSTTALGDSTASSAAETTVATVPDPDAPRVAFLYERVVADRGWSWTHAQAVQGVIDAHGDTVVVTAVEQIDNAAIAREVLRRLASDGYGLIVATAPSLSAPVLSVADEFPDVMFMVAGGSETAANVGTYGGAEEEAWFLAGMAAGSVTETGIIGFVAPARSPATVRSINAFALGVREQDETAEVHVVWSGTSFDPPVEGAAAQLLLDKDADVLASYQDSVAIGLIAESAGAHWIGWSGDTDQALPGSWLGTVTWDWGALYEEAVAAFLDESWQPPDWSQPDSPSRGSIASGMVDVVLSESSLDATVVMAISDARSARADGVAPPLFSDPITDSSGVLRELGDPFAMDFFVEGVIAP